jgi:hypothetical protein
MAAFEGWDGSESVGATISGSTTVDTPSAGTAAWELAANYGYAAVGQGLSMGVNFVDGLINGDEYREELKQREATQRKWAEDTGVSVVADLPVVGDIAGLPLKLSHASGKLGASAHAVIAGIAAQRALLAIQQAQAQASEG